MKGDTNGDAPTRLHTTVNSILLVLLVVLMLLLGSGIGTYMNQQGRTDDKIELVRMEYAGMLRVFSEDQQLKFNRVSEIIETDSRTKDRRIRLLELKVDSLQNEIDALTKLKK
jgi:hypothetical protein